MDEPQRSQLPNLPFINRWLKTEIKLFEGLHERQMRQLQLGSHVAGSASLHFAVQQLVQKIGIARLFFRRLLQ